MASIVKRGKGAFSVVHYEGEGAERHQVWDPCDDRKAARARKAEIEYAAIQNSQVERSNFTVREFLHEFVDKYGVLKWGNSSYTGNISLLENYVYPYLGDSELRSIRPKKIDDYYHYLLACVKPVTQQGKKQKAKIEASLIHSIHKVLRCAFNQAVKWEYIRDNPFYKATLPERKEKKRPALTPDQFHRVLEFTNRPEIYDYYVIHCAMQLSFACSLRGGEVGGAQWARYDTDNQMIYIDRVIDRVRKTLIEKLPKMEIKYRFPNMFPGTKTVIVLKQPKTEGSIRNAYIPDTVANKLRVLRGMQQKLQEELGNDGYMDYDLIICQANGRPIMTEHLNARFKAIIADMNDPTIPAVDFVFHSIRHTSTGFKLKVSKGDLKAVQGDGGWNTSEMITKRYAHILDEDRKNLANEMEATFYKNDSFRTDEAKQTAPALDANQIAAMLSQNPNLLVQVFQTIQQTKQA